MKKAFTLFELIISIILLFIIIFFLYDFYNNTKFTNTEFTKVIKKESNEQSLKNIFYEDFFQSTSINIQRKDKRGNQVISLITSNTFHDPFSINITYLVSREKELIRIESKDVFNREKLSKEFLKICHIDVLKNDVEKFEIFPSLYPKKYFLYIKLPNKNIKIPLLIF